MVVVLGDCEERESAVDAPEAVDGCSPPDNLSRHFRRRAAARLCPPALAFFWFRRHDFACCDVLFLCFT